MKITLTDKLHFSVGLNIFIVSWIGFSKLEFNYASGMALLVVTLFSIFKELNDWKGWIPFLLTDGKTKTGFNALDVWKGILLPLIITAIDYMINK